MKVNNLKHIVNYVHEHNFYNTEEKKIFGFWIYLMSDCIFFCCLFATYAVLVNNLEEWTSNKNFFELAFVLLETFFLLASSTTYGIAVLTAHENGDINKIIYWIGLTWFFGVCFIGMEFHEFYSLITRGLVPSRNAFFSAFFMLICTHSLHVIFGLIWMLTLMFLLFFRGLTDINRVRIICLSLFWHFLDIIWICLFSVVYLVGSI